MHNVDALDWAPEAEIVGHQLPDFGQLVAPGAFIVDIPASHIMRSHSVHADCSKAVYVLT